MTHRRLRHYFYLCDTLTVLSMSGADAVAARVASTNDEHILALGRDANGFAELHACKDTILLGEQFESEVNALQLPAGYL